MGLLNKLNEWLQRDEFITSGRGWSVNLDLFRVAYLSLAVLPWAFKNLDWVNGVMPHLGSTLWVPISFYRWIPFAILIDGRVAYALAIANLILLFLGLVGLYTRPSLACASVLSLYLFGLTENQGKIDHMHHIVWFLILLAVGPAGRFLSVDSLRHATRNARRAQVEPAVFPFDGLWTLRFVWVLLGLLYLIPGLAKLDKAIVAGWATSTNLENIFWRKWLELSLFSGAAPGPSIRLDHFPSWMIALGGMSAIAFEIGFLFVVLSRRLRLPAGVAGFGFHVLNGLALQIWFNTLLPAYISIVDWYALGRALLRADKRQTTVLYDSQCAFCFRALAVLKSLDLFDTLRLTPLDSADAQSLTSISREAKDHDLHVVDGKRTYAGYEGYLIIAERIPLLWPIFVFMRLPGISQLGRRVYRTIADSRHCSITSGVVEPISGPHAKKGVLIAGAILCICQFVIGFVMYADTDFRGKIDRMPSPIRRVALGIGKRMPVWPFTYYPTFASPTPSEQCFWRGSWLMDGRNVVISPATYEHAFHNSGTVWAIVTDPQRQTQALSLDLLHTLWRAESRSVQQTATGATVDRVCYRLGPATMAPGTVENSRVLFSLPLSEISH